MKPLIHLIYSSAARQLFAEADLIDLLAVSRANNAGHGITGILLYTDGSFFQVLEGEAETVDNLAKKIAQDSRHTKMVTIIREPIPRRAFGEWTMGFANITTDDIRQIVGLNDFFTDGSCYSQLDQGRAKKLLAAFKEGRWRSKVKNIELPTTLSAPTPVQMRPATMETIKMSFAYQPIIDSRSKCVVAFEALVRGVNNEPAATVIQQVSHSGWAYFDTDCRALAIAMAARLGLSCNLHVTFLALNAQDARAAIRSTIEVAEREHMDPSRIVLEVDQDRLIGDSSLVTKAIEEYRSAGLRIAIDHFGAGRAGLNLLEPYRPEMIGLNPNLVRDIDSNGPRQAIVRGVAQTCFDLGIDIIAKHVETRAEYEWFCDEGITTLFQGNLFASPGFERLPEPKYPTLA